jgi:hypothetical protein
MLGKQGDADAAGNGHGARLQGKRSRQVGDDAGSHFLDLAPRADIDQDRGELVATQSRDGVRGAHAGTQATRAFHQQFIAGGMAMPVIDRLETVEVDEAQGEAATVALRLGYRHPQAIAEQGAVGQVGQRIVVGPMAQLLLQLLAARDVGQRGNETSRLPGRGDTRLIDSQTMNTSPFLRWFQTSPCHRLSRIRMRHICP